MVSADNVNYDVLSLIFAYLATNDLVSVCLVSSSFRAGATPRLYRSIWFRMGNAKKWPKVTSPFDTIIARPSLGVHVRHCDVDTVPRLKGEPHPSFTAACAKSLALCPNLLSFTYMNEIPPFIATFSTMERLTELKIHAALSTEQANTLSRVRGLEKLSLHQASWNLCNSLSLWLPTMASTLTSLTLANSRFLNETVLDALLPRLPALRGLHIIGCSQVSHNAVFRLVSHTPSLESLSMSTWENCATTLEHTFPLLSLRHLSLDTRCTFTPHAVPDLYASLFAALAPCPLESLTFKLSERMVVSDAFITQVIDDHETTLTRLNAVNATLTDESIQNICMRCDWLEQLAVVFPVKHMSPFVNALKYASSLHTLIDVGDSHTVHGRRPVLGPRDVLSMFQGSVLLQKVISGNRCWTCDRTPMEPTDIDSVSDYVPDVFENKYDAEEYLIKLKLARLRGVTGRPVYEIADGGAC